MWYKKSVAEAGEVNREDTKKKKGGARRLFFAQYI